MSRRRRGILLVGLAILLGGLAASDVSSREAAMKRRIGPLVEVVVAQRDLEAGTKLRAQHLAVRRVPERYAPPGVALVSEEVVGQRLAVPVLARAYLSSTQLAVPDTGPAAPAVRRGERALEIVAAGSAGLVVPGARVDVLVTREGGGGAGGTELALQDVEVLAAAPAPEAAAPAAGVRVAATLRVTLRQAVYLTAAQSFARELRLLPRAAGDRRHARAVVVGEALR